MSLDVHVTGTNVTQHRHHGPHFSQIPNEAISILTPYSGLIVTLWMVILFLIRHYLLEAWLFRRWYRQIYSSMDDGLRRGFLNHHMAGGVKIVLFIAGVKPFLNVVFGMATLDTPMGKSVHPTMGDILLVLTQLFVAMYVFELFYRKTLSPIAIMHHVGAIVIAQSAVVLSLNLRQEVNATMEFVLCLVWGAFDVLAEFWLNAAFILYRVHYENHHFLVYLFFSTSIITVMGSVAETIMIMTLFGQSWESWELSFKVVTPILHIIFTLAQLHGSRILYAMWRKQQKLLAEEDRQVADLEGIAGQKERPDNEERKPSTGIMVASNNVPKELSSHRAESSNVQHNTSPTTKKPSMLAFFNKLVTGRP